MIRWAFGLAVTGLLLLLACEVVLLLFASSLVAIFLRGLARLIHDRTRLSMGRSILVVLLSLTAIVVGAVWVGAPKIAQQVDQFSVELPRSLDRLTVTIQDYEWGRWILRRAASIESVSDGEGGETLKEVGRDLSTRLATSLGDIASSSFGAIVYLAMSAAIGIYLAIGFDRYRHALLRLFPRHRRARAAEIVDVSIHALEGWLFGTAVSMAILCVLSFIGLSLLGVPLALTFALVTALLTFIPNIGPFLSVILPTLLALTTSPITSVYVVLFYLVLQNVEGFFITPMVQSRTALLPPPLLLATQLFMAVVVGFYGLLLAAPLCALGLVLVQMLYLEDHLGEHVEIPGYSSRVPATEAGNGAATTRSRATPAV